MIEPVSRKRIVKDKAAALLASVCGSSIIIALALMLGYLFWEAAVLGWPGSAEPINSAVTARVDLSTAPAADRQFWLSERGNVALEVSASGVRLLDFADGSQQPLHDWPELVEFAPRMLLRALPGSKVSLALDATGRALLFEPKFNLRWDAQTTDYHAAQVVPSIDYPVGSSPLDTALSGPPDRAAFFMDERQILLLTSVGEQLQLQRWPLRRSLFGDGYSIGQPELVRHRLNEPARQLLIGAGGLLYVLSQAGQLQLFRGAGDQLQPVDSLELLGQGASLASAGLLLGGHSLVVADDSGGMSLWRQVANGQGGHSMRRIRSYQTAPGAVGLLLAEPQRKGFFAFGSGTGQFHYIGEPDSQFRLDLSGADPIQAGWLEPAGRRLLLQSGSGLQYWSLDNEYADVSAGLLWKRQWYEGYQEADWIWQSTSADADFEPKFSLVPLVVGTLKGALYAMLFGAPLALLAAVYVAHFMAAGARAITKPLIELMNALPTVILGFLAALWLAPLVGRHLSGILLGMALVPFSLVAFVLLIHRAPAAVRHLIPPGWEFVPALPLCGLVFAGCVLSAPGLDAWLFGGDFVVWMDDELGINYEQRNAAVVGMAMSFAVLPGIFSISEDALFQVPGNLIQGGLAMGATYWQTVLQIVLPTASPGIFSALIIGLGRAVGETMVVVMATGNTPLVDWLPFTGMRTLSANIAVEMPEAEIGSSHFHLLFLSAVLLFLMTFAANSLAEYIRHRLRLRYASL